MKITLRSEVRVKMLSLCLTQTKCLVIANYYLKVLILYFAIVPSLRLCGWNSGSWQLVLSLGQWSAR